MKSQDFMCVCDDKSKRKIKLDRNALLLPCPVCFLSYSTIWLNAVFYRSSPTCYHPAKAFHPLETIQAYIDMYHYIMENHIQTHAVYICPVSVQEHGPGSKHPLWHCIQAPHHGTIVLSQ